MQSLQSWGKGLIILWLGEKWFCLVLDIKSGDIFENQWFSVNFATLQLQSWCYVAMSFPKNSRQFFNYFPK